MPADKTIRLEGKVVIRGISFVDEMSSQHKRIIPLSFTLYAKTKEIILVVDL